MKVGSIYLDTQRTALIFLWMEKCGQGINCTIFLFSESYILRGCTPLLMGPGGIDTTFQLFSIKPSKKKKKHPRL